MPITPPAPTSESRSDQDLVGYQRLYPEVPTPVSNPDPDRKGLKPMDPIRERPRRVSFDMQRDPIRAARKLVLCFDGTGNKFRGDDSDSNILKIYRMLDATAIDQYHYYQPGIGTYTISKSFTRSSISSRIQSWYHKTTDAAFGSSFDHHVIGGYRFLMRFYAPGDDIYLFGFSRGAYVVRFLAEMLDYVGLLGHGNEEMVMFAWKAFAQWQTRRHAAHTPNGQKESKKLYEFMKGFRETFSQPVKRIKFLGLFDTVNSVPHFEGAWMKRSRASRRFPYTARSSARVIRHAVAIDERRAKFRQHLLYQDTEMKNRKNKTKKNVKVAAGEKARHIREKFRPAGRRTSVMDHGGLTGMSGFGVGRRASLAIPERRRGSLAPPDSGRRYSITLPSETRRASLTNGPALGDGQRGSMVPGPNAERGLTPEGAFNTEGGRRSHDIDHHDPAPYRLHQSKSRVTIVSNRHFDGSRDDVSIVSHLPPSDAGYDSEDEDQDIDEVWFSGGHVDVGGGWEMIPEQRRVSHIPLVWMVREAMKAGLSFDLEQVVALGCMDPSDLYGSSMPGHSTYPASPSMGNTVVPNICIDGKMHHNSHVNGNGGCAVNGDAPCVHPLTTSHRQESSLSPWGETMLKAQTATIHDSLSFSFGLSRLQVISWNLMEYLPFKRMDLQSDGTWRPIRWPLPRGEVRDIPHNARIHGSVIRRMHADENYRPGNLIVGGGGRGCRRAPDEMGTGDWVCVAGNGDMVGEVWVRKQSEAARQAAETADQAMMEAEDRFNDHPSPPAGNGVVFETVRFQP
ncbi:uncharacterized protein MKZ38_001130 [Zalerion maritima]|uniref:T6SS Phospholipase effector Tle1-like catalytic domain-containing protein n=1 Tax=Zalerion maritima TaxID=339359 RepID=A0AAD5RQK3_9PEZI|nr:uncharacterized protein MKZ38_001130 [Zalerion maritima]